MFDHERLYRPYASHNDDNTSDIYTIAKRVGYGRDNEGNLVTQGRLEPEIDPSMYIDQTVQEYDEELLGRALRFIMMSDATNLNGNQATEAATIVNLIKNRLQPLADKGE